MSPNRTTLRAAAVLGGAAVVVVLAGSLVSRAAGRIVSDARLEAVAMRPLPVPVEPAAAMDDRVDGAHLLRTTTQGIEQRQDRFLVRDGDVPATSGPGKAAHESGHVLRPAPERDVHAVGVHGPGRCVLDQGGEGVPHGIPKECEEPRLRRDHS